MARICFADAIPLLPVPNTKTFRLFILIPLFLVFLCYYPYVNVLLLMFFCDEILFLFLFCFLVMEK